MDGVSCLILMKEIKVKLKNTDDIKDFNHAVTKIDGDVDLVSGRYVVDAKSIMGIFSLDISKPLICRINAVNMDEESAAEVLKTWVI